jgi:fatty-acid desaturase
MSREYVDASPSERDEQRESRPQDMQPQQFWVRLATALGAVTPFLAFLYAILQMWDRQVNGIDLILFFTFYLSTGLGICVGFHRLLTHRAFVTFSPVRAVLLALGSMAVEGPAVTWAATHLEHHAKSDREGDPHSPVEGFWHAHMGWIIGKYSAKPEVYARHLEQDTLVQFISRTFFGWMALTVLLPGLLDGVLSRHLLCASCHLERQFHLPHLWPATILRHQGSQSQ